MEAVDYYVRQARSGHTEDAFFGLLDLVDDPISALQEVYRIELDPEIRSLIVEVVWQRRQPSAIPFLANALVDPHPEAWKQALDGLVALGTPDAKRALETAILGSAGQDDERRAWIVEAIGQMTDTASMDEGE